MDRAYRLMVAVLLLGCINAHATVVSAPFEFGDRGGLAWSNVTNPQFDSPPTDPFFGWISHTVGQSGRVGLDQSFRDPTSHTPGGRSAGSGTPPGPVPVVSEIVALAYEPERPDPVIPIPEPEAWLMVLAGLVMLGVVAWRRARPQ